MATRIFLFSGTVAATTYTVVSTIDGATTLKPNSGIKWTVVELRLGHVTQVCEWKFNYDTEKYWNGRSELDFIAKLKPHTVTLDIIQPHFLEYSVKPDVSGTVVRSEVVVEESPVTGV